MKHRFFLFIFMFIGCYLFPQSFISERYFFNPRNDYFYIDGVYRERTIDASFVSEIYLVRYSIFDSAGTLVFTKDENNYHEYERELFITENSLIRISIPPFIWRGEMNPDYKRFKEISGDTAPEGEYNLIISIRLGITTEPELYTYRIIIDETPPVFTLKLFQNQSGQYILFTEGETADLWRYEIKEKQSGVIYNFSEEDIREDRFPVLICSLNEEEYLVTITAIDKAKNNYTIESVILPSSSGQSIVILSNEVLLNDNKTEESRSLSQYARISDIRRVQGEKYPYLDLPDITFSGNQSGGLLITDSANNMNNIRNTANIILSNIDEIKFVHIHGYANPLLRNAGARERRMEEERILKPLSLKRAEYIKDIFILLGIPENKIKIAGLGSEMLRADPFNNRENWKNRVVKFYVE